MTKKTRLEWLSVQLVFNTKTEALIKSEAITVKLLLGHCTETQVMRLESVIGEQWLKKLVLRQITLHL